MKEQRNFCVNMHHIICRLTNHMVETYVMMCIFFWKKLTSSTWPQLHPLPNKNLTHVQLTPYTTNTWRREKRRRKWCGLVGHVSNSYWLTGCNWGQVLEVSFFLFLFHTYQNMLEHIIIKNYSKWGQEGWKNKYNK